MNPTVEQADLAKALSMLATRLDKVAAKARHGAQGLIVGWYRPEDCDALADVLDEAARQVRLNRPTVVVEGDQA